MDIQDILGEVQGGIRCQEVCPLDTADLAADEMHEHIPRACCARGEYCMRMAAWMMYRCPPDHRVPIDVVRGAGGRPGVYDGRHRICIAMHMRARGIYVHWPVRFHS